MRFKIFVAIGLFILISCSLVIYLRAAKGGIPQNIFCLQDIGTHHIPIEFIEVNDGQTVGQTFVPNFPNLFKIAVFVAVDDIEPAGTIRFHLRQVGSVEDIFFQEWKLGQIHRQKNSFYVIPPDPFTKKGFHYHIQFPPIYDSAGKEYYFYFESPNVPIGKGIKLGMWRARYYEALRSGTRYINHRGLDYFISFRTFNTWIGNDAALFKEIRARLSKDMSFTIFYLLSVITILCGILLIREV